MDKADAARRVRALRALGVDPGATVSERSAANDKADELERKYGKAEPRSVYTPRHEAPDDGHVHMGYDEYLRWKYAGYDLRGHPWSGPRVRLYVVHDDLDDIVEDGYLFQWEDGPPNDVQ